MSEFNHALNLTHDGTLILRIPKGYEVDKVVVEEMGTDDRRKFVHMPSDISDYCDKLWELAYERGKAEGQPTHKTPSNTLGALDCVERQKAIDALDKRFDSIPMEQTTEILLLRKDLRELPSAQPRKGKWIEASEDWRNQITWWQCSECGTPSSIKSNFCPNCGCRMEEGDSE